MIRVLIVDDQYLIREGLRMMLSLYDGIEIVGEVTNGEEAIQLLEELEVDLLLMDVRMPVMDGVVATKVIKEKYPDVKVLILTTFDEDEYIFKALQNGADGYLLKDISSENLVGAINTVFDGNMLLQPDIAKKVVESIEKSKTSGNFNKDVYNLLTKKEYEIALLIGEGKSNKEISSLLYITEGTVKNHVTNILSKLELRDRTQLALSINQNPILWGDF
ncbi:MAG: response regulator transcription factor [Tissierellaceae bacterium]|nr:response regulator transcription factor [Tissierellaceae bacterium]